MVVNAAPIHFSDDLLTFWPVTEHSWCPAGGEGEQREVSARNRQELSRPPYISVDQ